MKKKNFATAAIACATIYQLLLIALIRIRPDLPVYSTTISEWAIGRYGWLMQLAFLISALSYLFLLFTINHETSGKTGKAGLFLLFISFLGTVVVGLFVTDPYPPDFSNSTTLVHTIGGTMAMVLYPISILLIALNIAKRNEHWGRYKPLLRIIAFLPLIAFIAFNVHMILYVIPLGEGAAGENVPIGYPPRIMFLVYHFALITLSILFIKKEQIKTLKYVYNKNYSRSRQARTLH